jgi:orotidine-5'-phosphate decarboxylase
MKQRNQLHMAGYSARLNAAIKAKQTPALVGIDPRFDQLPAPVRASAAQRVEKHGGNVAAAAFEEFGIRLIDVVASLVPAVKPQSAFFEQLGPAGTVALGNVVQHARKAGLIVVLDAKRSDIGSTADAYAKGYLAGEDPGAAPWGADALTVNPYLGSDTLQPFVDVATSRGAAIYVLVRTSNPGAAIWQDRVTDGQRVFESVADTVEALAQETVDESGFGCVGAVVGATWPAELTELRQRMPHVPLLVPGYGSQGADASDVAGGFNDQGLGAIVNSSRAINFAHLRAPYSEQFSPDQWEAAVAAATRDMIADLASHTTASALQNPE